MSDLSGGRWYDCDSEIVLDETRKAVLKFINQITLAMKGDGMGFISFILVTLIQIGAFASGLYCAFQYMHVSLLAQSAMHEITATLFGLGAILSFGIFAVICLLCAIESGFSKFAEESHDSTQTMTNRLSAIHQELHDNLQSPNSPTRDDIDAP